MSYEYSYLILSVSDVSLSGCYLYKVSKLVIFIWCTVSKRVSLLCYLSWPHWYLSLLTIFNVYLYILNSERYNVLAKTICFHPIRCFRPFPLSIHFYTFSFKFITIAHKNTSLLDLLCPVKRVHINDSNKDSFFMGLFSQPLFLYITRYHLLYLLSTA